MVTKEDVSQLADIAEIYLDNGELETLTASLQRVIAFADKINEVPCDCKEFCGFDDIGYMCREDELSNSYNREEILLNAKSNNSEFFVLETGLFK